MHASPEQHALHSWSTLGRWSVWFWCSYATNQIASSYWSVVVEDATSNEFTAYGYVEASNQVSTHVRLI